MNATISIAVDPLVDNTIWFANAAAWNNYWESVTATIDIDPISTTRYTEVPYNTGLSAGAPVINIAGTDYILCTKEMFDSLRTEVLNLNTSYKTLRTELRNNGLITNAQ